MHKHHEKKMKHHKAKMDHHKEKMQHHEKEMKHAKKNDAKKKHVVKKSVKGLKAKGKVAKVMHEFANKELHSSSKKGPIVKNKRQALAIALSEQRKTKK